MMAGRTSSWPTTRCRTSCTSNNGNGTFTEVGLESGVAFTQNGNSAASMGGDFGDYDLDGRLDLMVPDMAYNAVYHNLGKGLFEDVSATIGWARASAQFWSWGGGFFDYDNDGYLDIMYANGDGHRLSEALEQLLMRNRERPERRPHLCRRLQVRRRVLRQPDGSPRTRLR